MLLRKYSVSGNVSIPPSYSSLSSSPAAPPIESTKKRRRFYKKANLGREMRKEAGQVQEGAPCRSPSQVAEPPVRAVTSIPHPPLNSGPSHFTLLYHTLVRDGALPLGYLQEFISLESPARRSANRLQASAVAVTDSAASMTLDALRRESEHRASVEVSISDQMVIAADPRNFARDGNVLYMMAPRLERMLSLRSGIAGSSFSRTCSGSLTRRWES